MIRLGLHSATHNPNSRSETMKTWILNTARVFRREFSMIFRDAGVMLFFFALPLAYPLVYALIYNPEVTSDIPVAVVDECRSAASREFVRDADATQAMKICGYASNLAEAKRWWQEKKCFAVIYIPSDYSKEVGRGDQGLIQFYCDMGLLLRYRTLLSAMTELQMATDNHLREEAIATMGLPIDTQNSTIRTESYFLGDTQQGFASFIMPGIVVLIIQQSLILGITMLCGTSKDRRRRNNGVDPLMLPVSASSTVIGRTLCYVTIYLPLCLYVLHFVQVFFHFPHIGSVLDYMLFILPMLLASAFLAQSVQWMLSERESAFIVVVFTSVAFLFLSGLTWPRYAMSEVFRWLGNLVPATWGMEGFIRMNSNGSPLYLQSTPYLWLWGLTVVYFITAVLATRADMRTRPRPLPA